MYYSSIKLCDCANGVGVRTVLFVSGCTHHCKGCFNPDTWDFKAGKEYTPETEEYILQSMANGYTDGLTVLGGEPMELPNQEAILPLLRKTKEAGKTIWVYSGYTWEELTDKNNARCHGEHTMEILNLVDVLVDGEFQEDKKDIRLLFRGSSNQRIIACKKSVEAGHVILE